MQHTTRGGVRLDIGRVPRAMLDSFMPAYKMFQALVIEAAKKVEQDPSRENIRLAAAINRDFRDTTFQHQKITEQLLPKIKEYKQLALGIMMLGRRFCEALGLGEPAYLKYTEMADETFGLLFKGVGREVVAEYEEITNEKDDVIDADSRSDSGRTETPEA